VNIGIAYSIGISDFSKLGIGRRTAHSTREQYNLYSTGAQHLVVTA
tara:strand:+ start:555 stop:692 length:138 start_codon:yes stop_codon:yes gene_type:complete